MIPTLYYYKLDEYNLQDESKRASPGNSKRAVPGYLFGLVPAPDIENRKDQVQNICG